MPSPSFSHVWQWLEYLESITPQPPATPPEVLLDYASGSSKPRGYWGAVDSNVDWCELNYATSPYIAEFFNTLSSLPMCFWSLVGMYFTYKYATKELRWQLCFASLCLVGVGSFLFHATLRFSAQLFDEIPMLIAVSTMLYALVTIHDPPKKRFNCLLVFFFVAVTVAVTAAYIISGVWFIFLFSYGIQVIILMGCASYYLQYGSWTFRLFAAATLSYSTAWCLWLTDMYYCHDYQAYQLHSIWHLGAGYGTYLAILCMLTVRVDYLAEVKRKKDRRKQMRKYTTDVNMSGFLVPYVSLTTLDVHVD